MDVQDSVIIPTFEDWGVLQLCLDCLARQTADPTLFEVIVANNNPDPAVPPTLRLPANAQVIHAPKPGSYAARNAAIKVARGEVLFFTDSDCLPDPSWIAAGLDAMSGSGTDRLVAGQIELFPVGTEWTPVELHGRIFSLKQDDYVSQGWCATANLMARRRAFEDYGPFNENRFSGGDKEWTLHATSQGANLVYVAEVVIRHPARSSYSVLATRTWRVIGGNLLDMQTGRIPRAPLRYYLSPLSSWETRQVMSHPGMTDLQRAQVLWLCVRLNVVALSEVVRLRYLSGRPQRS